MEWNFMVATSELIIRRLTSLTIQLQDSIWEQFTRHEEEEAEIETEIEEEIGTIITTEIETEIIGVTPQVDMLRIEDLLAEIVMTANLITRGTDHTPATVHDALDMKTEDTTIIIKIIGLDLTRS